MPPETQITNGPKDKTKKNTVHLRIHRHPHPEPSPPSSARSTRPVRELRLAVHDQAEEGQAHLLGPAVDAYRQRRRLAGDGEEGQEEEKVSKGCKTGIELPACFVANTIARQRRRPRGLDERLLARRSPPRMATTCALSRAPRAAPRHPPLRGVDPARRCRGPRRRVPRLPTRCSPRATSAPRGRVMAFEPEPGHLPRAARQRAPQRLRRPRDRAPARHRGVVRAPHLLPRRRRRPHEQPLRPRALDGLRPETRTLEPRQHHRRPRHRRHQADPRRRRGRGPARHAAHPRASARRPASSSSATRAPSSAPGPALRRCSTSFATFGRAPRVIDEINGELTPVGEWLADSSGPVQLLCEPAAVTRRLARRMRTARPRAIGRPGLSLAIVPRL